MTFYTQKMHMPLEEAVNELLPMTVEPDRFTAKRTMIKAMLDLKDNWFVKGLFRRGIYHFGLHSRVRAGY